MCDYSLESQISRSAQAGDRIKTSAFPNTRTWGFLTAETGASQCAFCPALKFHSISQSARTASGVDWSTGFKVGHDWRGSGRLKLTMHTPITMRWNWTMAALSC